MRIIMRCNIKLRYNQFQLMNSKREYIKDAIMEALEVAISDKRDLEKAQKIYSDCHETGKDFIVALKNNFLHYQFNFTEFCFNILII